MVTNTLQIRFDWVFIKSNLRIGLIDIYELGFTIISGFIECIGARLIQLKT